MRRRLTGREAALLTILLLLMAAAGYYLWFYVPVTEKQNFLEGQIQETEVQIQDDQIRIVRMREMEQKVEEIFAAGTEPVSMAPYDNAQNVMFFLNSILSAAEDYSLNFTSVDKSVEEGIVCRRISLNFRGNSYESARQILQELHDSPCRCMLDDLNVTIEKQVKENTAFENSLWWLEEEKTSPEKETRREKSLETENRKVESPEAENRREESQEAVNVSAALVFFEYIR